MNIRALKKKNGDAIDNVGLYLTAYLSDIEVEADAEGENTSNTSEDTAKKRIIKRRKIISISDRI